jgi:hypothetical protein
MFLLYHSEGCNICRGLFRKCYVNDLHTTTCSGMLGHRIFLVYTYALTRPFSQAFLKGFIALGTECAEYLKVAKASEGMFYIQS